MENNYPIQLVKIRENQDEYFKEGISDGKLPSWVTKEEIIKHIRQLDSDLEDVSKRFKERPTYNQKLPVLLKAKLNERATAKSYRPNVRSVRYVIMVHNPKTCKKVHFLHFLVLDTALRIPSNRKSYIMGEIQKRESTYLREQIFWYSREERAFLPQE